MQPAGSEQVVWGWTRQHRFLTTLFDLAESQPTGPLKKVALHADELRCKLNIPLDVGDGELVPIVLVHPSIQSVLARYKEVSADLQHHVPLFASQVCLWPLSSLSSSSPDPGVSKILLPGDGPAPRPDLPLGSHMDMGRFRRISAHFVGAHGARLSVLKRVYAMQKYMVDLMCAGAQWPCGTEVRCTTALLSAMALFSSKFRGLAFSLSPRIANNEKLSPRREFERRGQYSLAALLGLAAAFDEREALLLVATALLVDADTQNTIVYPAIVQLVGVRRALFKPILAYITLCELGCELDAILSLFGGGASVVSEDPERADRTLRLRLGEHTWPSGFSCAVAVAALNRCILSGSILSRYRTTVHAVTGGEPRGLLSYL